MNQTDRVLLVFGVAIFLFCLPFDAFHAGGRQHKSPGWLILLVGALGWQYGRANLVWLANPLLFGAWSATYYRHQPLAILLSFSALMVGAAFQFSKNVVDNEGGVAVQITERKAGYWLWLASMAASCIAALLLP